ncbi:MAG: lipocalin family protein [Flavobacteriales bacterium]
MKAATAVKGSALFLFSLFSCRTMPEGAQPVTDFRQEKYLGKWYEIARLDFRFEKNLNNTTAEYSLNADGSIRVLNRGYNYRKQRRQQALGKAKPAGEDGEGRLKVSFFGPFYAPYNVIAIDPDYRYALVAGKNLRYLWFLSREKTMPEAVKEKYLRIASELGYKTGELVWVQHSEEGS